MKNQIITALLLATTAYAEKEPLFKAGETNSIGPGLKIHIESISATNLYNVTLYEYDPLDVLKRTARTKQASYDFSEPGVLTLNLYNVTLKQTAKDGREQIIKAKLYPVRVKVEPEVKTYRNNQSTNDCKLALYSHIVYADESLNDIARMYGVPVEKMRKINGLVEGQLIKAGDDLKIPIYVERGK